jgi:hypothetical protein
MKKSLIIGVCGSLIFVSVFLFGTTSALLADGAINDSQPVLMMDQEMVRLCDDDGAYRHELYLVCIGASFFYLHRKVNNIALRIGNLAHLLEENRRDIVVLRDAGKADFKKLTSALNLTIEPTITF